MKHRLFFTILAVLWSAAAWAIVPQPRFAETGEGSFTVTPSTVLSFSDESLKPLAIYLIDYGVAERVAAESPDKDYIRLAVDSGLGEEAYVLNVSQSGITIEGGGYGGVFNGIQTLFQLLPDKIYTHQFRLPATIGCIRVEDAPQFAFRAFMLDVTRTWSDADRVKRYIDLISYHKINKLHILLANDEGWRVEIKSHPELVNKGAWRGGDSPVKSVFGKWGERYGGYYTQQQLRDIIDYAAVRNIEVIPEIDLPGHSRTMAQIHPEVLCDYTPDFDRTDGYEYRSAWCVTREENYTLIEDILSEICELFPSEYIHIGGDEVDMSQWKKCPHCSAYAAKHFDNDFHRMEEMFVTRVIDIVARHGKKAGVWNEAINGGTLTKEALVFGWESTKACLNATGRGYHTIVMPGQYFYLDMKQSPREEGHTWAAIVDTEDCYSYDLSKQGFTPEQIANIDGFEATFFSELYVSHNPETAEYLDYQLFPRLCAVSEIAWGRNGSDWADFNGRLKSEHYDRLAGMGITFRLPPPTVSYSDGRISAATDLDAPIFWSKEYEDNWHRYTSPIKTDKPAEYLFRVEYRTAKSPTAGVAKHYERSKPAFKLTSTMPENSRYPFSNAETYRGESRSTRTCHTGDTILFEFETPLRCREVVFLTGREYIPKYIFDSGYLEISTDGKTFERVAELEGGRAKLVNPAPIKAARLVSTCQGNGTPFVVIPAPIIKPLL